MHRGKFPGMALLPWIGLVVALALPVQAQPETEGRSTARAWLGVWLGDAVDGGVQIVALVTGGPAQRAGLQVGDIILEADERPTPEKLAVTRVLEARTPGQSIELVVSRSGRLFEQTVQLDRRVARAPRIPMPAAPPLPPHGGDPVGGQVAEMTPALRAHYGGPPDAGVLVTRVADAGPLAAAGIEVGDVLVELGGQRLREPAQLERTLSGPMGSEELDALVVRAREERRVTFPALPRAAPGPPDRRQHADRLEREIRELERRLQRLRRELRELRERP